MSYCDISASTDFDELMEATYSKNPTIRKKALKEFCPCHVKKDIEKIWDRILEMKTDESPVVRDQVVHSLCDGSPKERETEVIATLEELWNDPDERVRRRVRKALNAYRRTGNWNVL